MAGLVGVDGLAASDHLETERYAVVFDLRIAGLATLAAALRAAAAGSVGLEKTQE